MNNIYRFNGDGQGWPVFPVTIDDPEVVVTGAVVTGAVVTGAVVTGAVVVGDVVVAVPI